MFFLDINKVYYIYLINLKTLSLGSIFDLVRPTNSACTGDTGDKGSCLTSRDCSERGGHSIGVCANGLAQCCYCKCCHLLFIVCMIKNF